MHDRWLASLVGYVPVKINEADPVFSVLSSEWNTGAVRLLTLGS